MNTLVQDPVFQIYVGTAIALALNLIFLANGTALTRSKHAEVINPEDKKLNAEAAVVFMEGNDTTSRFLRAHRNALENLPLFLVTALLLPFVGASKTVALALCVTFAVARWLHSICYLKGIQPFRTMFFAIGFITQLVLLGFVAKYVFFA